MQLLINHSTDPAFNLALEEYALTRLGLDLIMLWRNSASVIIGRNQNALEEIDTDYVRENTIPVIRRQSGGGAVFHDLGNINYTVIQKMGGDDFSNYAKFTAPVVAFLQSLGVEASLEGRNDLVIGGMKFSGNAQAAKNGRIMHHGTILYNADTERLAKALRPKPAKIESKGVKSVRARVTNVANHLPCPMTAEEFFGRLAAYFRETGDITGEYELTQADVDAVHMLVEEKYGTWDWNIGHSPDYNYEKSVKFPFGMIELRLTVANGKMEQVRIFGDFFGILEISALESLLTGTSHSREAIAGLVRGIALNDYIYGISEEQFLDLFS